MHRLAYYVILATETEHEIRGPYSRDTRDSVARILQGKDQEFNLYWLDVVDGRPALGEFPVDFFPMASREAPAGRRTKSNNSKG